MKVPHKVPHKNLNCIKSLCLKYLMALTPSAKSLQQFSVPNSCLVASYTEHVRRVLRQVRKL